MTFLSRCLRAAPRTEIPWEVLEFRSARRAFQEDLGRSRRFNRIAGAVGAGLLGATAMGTGSVVFLASGLLGTSHEFFHDQEAMRPYVTSFLGNCVRECLLYCPRLLQYAGSNLAQKCKGLYTGDQAGDQIVFIPLFGKNSRTTYHFREMLLAVLNAKDEDLSAKLAAECALREQDKQEMQDALVLAEKRRHELDALRAEAEDLRRQKQQITNVKVVCGMIFLLGLSAGLGPYVFGNVGFYVRVRSRAQLRAASLRENVRALQADFALERQYSRTLRDQQASLRADMANQEEIVNTRQQQLAASEEVVVQQREALKSLQLSMASQVKIVKQLEGDVKTREHQLATSQAVIAQQDEALKSLQASLRTHQVQLEELKVAIRRQQEGCQTKRDELPKSHAEVLLEPKAVSQRIVQVDETREPELQQQQGKRMMEDLQAEDGNMTLESQKSKYKQFPELPHGLLELGMCAAGLGLELNIC